MRNTFFHNVSFALTCFDPACVAHNLCAKHQCAQLRPTYSFMSRIPTRSNPSPPLNVIGVARFPRTMESDDMSTVRLETAAAITLFLASHVCGA